MYCVASGSFFHKHIPETADVGNVQVAPSEDSVVEGKHWAETVSGMLDKTDDDVAYNFQTVEP